MTGYKCSVDREGRGGLLLVHDPFAPGATTVPTTTRLGIFGDYQSTITELLVTDLDGDGTTDLAVGQPGGDERRDGIRIIRDAANYFAGAADEVWLTATAGSTEQAGASMAVLDLDRDGELDLAIGAPGTSTIRVIRGPLSTLAQAPIDSLTSFVISGPPSSQLGASLVAWDADLDGALELVAGAPGDASGSGRVYGFSAVATSTSTASAAWVIDGLPGDGFGARVATGGDIDGDGTADLFIGAPATLDSTSQLVGSIALFAAAPGFASTTALGGLARYLGPLAGAAWYDGGFVGDLDGDGRSEVAVGVNDGGGSIITVHTASGGAIPRWTLMPSIGGTSKVVTR